MSIRQGNNIISGAKKKECVLFEPQWFDYVITDMNWARADTFKWYNGLVYTVAYQHLLNDIQGKEPQSEVIGDTTIWFYLADDGHKIVPGNNANLVEDIYNATGIAWYYILDTTNQQFKLPRTKFAFTGFRDAAGKYVAPGVPTHTHSVGISYDNNGNWASAEGNQANSIIGYKSGVSTADKQGPVGTLRSYGVSGTFGDRGVSEYKNTGVIGSPSDSTYRSGTTVQPPATQMYLYFYIGDFTTSALENMANINLSLLEDLLNSVSNLNAHRVIDFQAPTAENNQYWYRKYADGWVEQGGIKYVSALGTQVDLPVTMENGSYTLTLGNSDTSGDAGIVACAYRSKAVDNFVLDTGYNGTFYAAYVNWQVSGMAA